VTAARDERDRQRWQQVRQIYEAALERTGADRDAWLRSTCEGDAALRQDVESLLALEHRTAGFLEAPAANAAAAILPYAVGGELSGRTIGRYTVASWIDAGGMGDVYRATDSTLERDVAVKVLPLEFAGDPQRVARFRREAHLLGTLNHPNIATIYAFEDVGDVLAIVLELVDGRTLAQLLADEDRARPMRFAAARSRPGLPLRQALGIARQIADALEAAHDRGIVHRDLKPANVMVRADGTAKVLDFGLAAAFSVGGRGTQGQGSSSSDGLSEVFGTPAFVSPEQAQGHATDKRADIWAFGCVLYEMLTGRPAFGGATTADTIAAVLEREPDYDALPHDTPGSIRRLLRRCLEKDSTRRLRDIGDARLELMEPVTADGSEPALRARPRHWVAIAAYVILAAAVTATLVLLATRAAPAPDPPVVRFPLTLPAAYPAVSFPTQNLALSADGTHLAYRSIDAVVVRALDALAFTSLPLVRQAQPFFLSSDGTWLGFVDSGGLKRAPVAGGPAVPVASATVSPPGFFAGGSWGPGDVIVLADDDGIHRMPASGGGPRRLLHPRSRESRERLAWPQMLSDGASVLFTRIADGTGEDGAQLEVLDLRTGSRKPVVHGGSRGRYVASGHILYASKNTLFAVAFDVERMETRGKPVVMVPNISDNNFAVSETGTLVYLSGASVANTLVWVDRHGREDPLAAPPGSYVYPRMSPDGSRVAVDVSGPNRDIWIWHIGRGTFELLTVNDPSDNPMVAWSADGTRIAFGSTRFGVSNLFMQNADGSGVPQRLLESSAAQVPLSFTADNQYLIFAEQKAGQEWDQMAVSIDEPRRVIPLVRTTASEMSGEVSPDGRWIAYSSDESGRQEVYVRSFPDSTRQRTTISSAGGKQPQWSRDGRELFYLSHTGAMMAVRMSETPAVSFGQPVELFPDAGYGHLVGARSYDLAGDGRFLMTKTRTPSGTPPALSLEVVHNWFGELKRLVPPGW
jgi:eukaryotic-like serine/threonine-protein kinase